MPVTGKRVLLAGIEHPLVDSLAQHLSARGLEIHEAETLPAANQTQPFDIAFCETHQPGLMALLQSVPYPVIVVSRVPNTKEWLDAMDAGAADYCAAPFEPEQLDWILEFNIFRRQSALTAA